ncbi:MAG: hypothetical protein JXR56_03040, partial [Candidatus Cloacimonetes bacterium]|nr:hypothetical protein [Candidatus Cloacimonadota bacterium]
ANARVAKKQSLEDFCDYVTDSSRWDYKKNEDFVKDTSDAGFTEKDRDDFGNFNFGLVANAWGFNLETSVMGAGAHQVIMQEGGSVYGMLSMYGYYNLTLGGYLISDRFSSYITNNIGFTWGDNKGDASHIIEGWFYAEENY